MTYLRAVADGIIGDVNPWLISPTGFSCKLIECSLAGHGWFPVVDSAFWGSPLFTQTFTPHSSQSLHGSARQIQLPDNFPSHMGPASVAAVQCLLPFPGRVGPRINVAIGDGSHTFLFTFLESKKFLKFAPDNICACFVFDRRCREPREISCPDVIRAQPG